MAKPMTRRLEARLDEDTDDLITRAAELMHVSKSAFVTQVARAEAERVVARSNVTLMTTALFEALMHSLDEPDAAPELERKLARLPRMTGP